MGRRADGEASPPPSARAAEALAFPRVARLELDELLVQLVDRAQEVMRTQSRLQGLLQATQAVATDLSLPALLQRIVTVARELVGARYAALAVIGDDDRPSEFVYSGVDEASARAIGHPPRGHGVLGLLIADSRPLRVRDVSAHTQAHGFPPGHPQMRSFLGVPIQIRGKAFGNLYLAEKRDEEEFSAEDEALVEALAASAAAAIDNARLYATVATREHWLMASRRITNVLLGVVDRTQALQLVAREAREAAGADVAAVVLPDGPDQLAVEVVDGAAADALRGVRVPVEGSRVGEAYRTGRALVVPDAGLPAAPTGPAMLAPLVSGEETQPVVGVLLTGSRGEGASFHDGDLEMLGDFAGQAALTLNVAAAQEAARRTEMLEDRARIARDLHDHVIQRLFAVGLDLQALASGGGLGQHQAELLTSVEALDDVIKDIRTTVFALRRADPAHASGLRARVLDLAEEVAPALGHSPRVQLEGTIDSAVPAPLHDDVLAVLREALSNAARHAAARSIAVRVSAADDELVLEVRDDGRGMPEAPRRSGLHNIAARAERHGGSCTVRSAPWHGTTVRWQVPLGLPREGA